MAGDYSLADLAEDAGVGGDGSASESGGESGGQWVDSLIDKLDSKGVLDALIEGQMGEAQQPQQSPPQQPQTASEPQPTRSDGGTQQIDAEGIKQALLVVYDKGGTVPGLPEDPTVSDLIKLIDSYPQMADKLIGQYMSGEEVADD